MTILRNRAKCLLCKDVIESSHRHDFKSCSCRNLFVDGGKDYLRRGWSEEASWEEWSETDNGA